MYEVRFTQVFEIEDISKAREMAGNLTKQALAGIKAIETVVRWKDKEEGE